MIYVIQGLKDRKVQVVLDGNIQYEFTNSLVELEDSHLLIKSGGNVLIRMWANECEWFVHFQVP